MNERGNLSSKKTRVALVGAGKMAIHHMNAIRQQRNAGLIAVADPVLSGSQRPAFLEKEVEIYSSAEDLLINSKPDVVHICTPPATHASLARIALQHGAHVYVEKPFALTERDAMEVISLAKEKGLRVCAGHQLLFESPTLRANENLKMLGRIVHIESYFSFKPVRRSRDGRTTISPLDQLVDILPHPVYLLLHFLKKNSQQEKVPVEIRALEVRTSGNVHGILSYGEVTGILILTLEGRPIESYIKIIGTNGCLYADFVRGAMILLPGPGISAITKIINPYKQSWKMTSETTRALFRRLFKKQKSYPGLVEIIGNFYGELQGDVNFSSDYASILETVAICEEVTKKLEIAEREENRIARKEFDRLESELSPTDMSRGGILITGGTGMLGKAVAGELRRRNWYTRVIGRRTPLVTERIPGVEYVQADLAEHISPEILRGISCVVHCAAETAGGKDAHERNSIGATRNILEAMNMTGVKNFLHISSIAVLKTSKEISGPVSEGTPLATDEGRGPYVWGKAESERLAKELCETFGVNLRVIRPGPLVDYSSFEPPGRLGREVGSYFIYIGSKRSQISLCTIQTAANVIGKYVEDFHSMPPVLNLVEPNSLTRAELVSRLLLMRPDLRAYRIPSGFLWALSPVLTLLQKIIRPGEKPVDIYAVFATEKYNSKLAETIIQSAKVSRPPEMKDFHDGQQTNKTILIK